MITQELTYPDLNITPAEIYEQMGYGNAVPDADVQAETERMIQRVQKILRPRFCFFITKATLDTSNNTLTTGTATMQIGKIISRQLRGSSAFVFFVATAGMEFEELQEQLKAEGDMVSIFIADAMGSVIAEKTADCMERVLQDTLNPAGMKRTNRFSPGYCGWHVSQQHLLFSHFPTPQPCGITLSDSSLMTPIKSVSGVIGIGTDVRYLDYTCGLCDYKDCYKRRRK